MRKIIIVVGPTAVGKTALALKIAQKHKGILFSADSIQVYIGLDIISGKDKDTLSNTPLKLVDLVLPSTPYSVNSYVSDFEKELSRTSLLPVLVGGTGFYISALLQPIETRKVKSDSTLRSKLNSLSVLELQNILHVLDAEKLQSMNNSDRNNPRRLIRAIEIGSRHPERSEGSWESSLALRDQNDILLLGLLCDKQILNKRVDERVEERIKHGALIEAEGLFENYESLAPQIKEASGYKQLFEHLQGKYSLEQAIEKWKTAEHQNAKKQMTWFKKQKNIEWFDIQDEDFEAKVFDQVEQFLLK